MVYGSDSITRGAGASLVSETSDEGKGRRGHLVLAMLGEQKRMRLGQFSSGGIFTTGLL